MTIPITEPLNRPIHFALIGDTEPKQEPFFASFKKTINTINVIHAQAPFDFAAGIGDIPHKGTPEQYEGATQYLDLLPVPLFTIMGNEELGGGRERFFQYAKRWRKQQPEKLETRFVLTSAAYAFIFITAEDNGVKFNTEELAWLKEQAHRYSDKYLLLFTHAPVRDIFDINQARAIPNEGFQQLLQSLNIRIHFSGHVHIAVDFVPTHIADNAGVHYIHVPGIERTKVGDKHTPRFRTVALASDGDVDIQTYNLEKDCFEEEFRIRFSLG